MNRFFAKTLKKKYIVIPNAIELDKFKFDVQQRAKIRKELKINDNTMVIGHIGRFCEPKNHDKLIDIFREDLYEKKELLSIFIDYYFLQLLNIFHSHHILGY